MLPHKRKTSCLQPHIPEAWLREIQSATIHETPTLHPDARCTSAGAEFQFTDFALVVTGDSLCCLCGTLPSFNSGCIVRYSPVSLIPGWVIAQASAVSSSFSSPP